MRSASFRSWFLCLTFVLTWANTTSAQPIASSLEELKRLAGADAKATVTDASGQEFRGTIADASESLLSLRIGSGIRQFQAADVRSVRLRKQDSLVNGALVGAAVSGGLTSLMFLDNECHNDPVCYQAVAVYAGIGALAGLGVDALIHASVVVFSAPAAGARVVRVAPIVAREGKGVRLTVAF
jgi:hypothetical protein